jgi:dienelactone hydrolase
MGSGRLVVAGALVLSLAACAGATSNGRGARARVAVSPARTSVDEPVHIVVRSLAPRQLVSLSLRSVDSRGIPWASSAAFRADRSGVVEVDRAAPVSGPYLGAWGMGLLAMLVAAKPDPGQAYYWDRRRSQTFTLTVRSGGTRLASTTFRRRFVSRPVRREHKPLSRNGFYGDYSTARVAGRRPAILAIGGSEGGDLGAFLASEALAARGYPVLDIAYFKEPGLPQTLSRVPLEYFARALAWLRAQPHVDPKRIVALGVSRGSEAALLLGAYYPQLVHAAIAIVPASVAVCSYPSCDGPAWTFGGKAVPYTRQLGAVYPTDNPAAVIPVEGIRGPVLLECAGNDQIWPSCPYAAAIMRRLDAHHDPHRHSLYRAPGAGHFIGSLLPNEPVATGNTPFDEIARETFWPQLLGFLAGL